MSLKRCLVVIFFVEHEDTWIVGGPMENIRMIPGLLMDSGDDGAHDAFILGFVPCLNREPGSEGQHLLPLLAAWSLTRIETPHDEICRSPDGERIAKRLCTGG